MLVWDGFNCLESSPLCEAACQLQVEKVIHFELATQCNTFAFTADSCPLHGSEMARLASPTAKAAAKAELCAIDDVRSLASNR